MPEQTYIFNVSVPAGATDVFIPVKERCKLRGMRVVCNTARGAVACGAYKGTTKLAEVASMGASGVVDKAVPTAAMETNIFEEADPIKVTFAAGTATLATIQLKLDPFCIQQFHKS